MYCVFVIQTHNEDKICAMMDYIFFYLVILRSKQLYYVRMVFMAYNSPSNRNHVKRISTDNFAVTVFFCVCVFFFHCFAALCGACIPDVMVILAARLLENGKCRKQG